MLATAAHHLLVALALRKASQLTGGTAHLAMPGDAAVQPATDLGDVARNHVGGTCAVIEAHERLGDDEPALREVTSFGRERNDRLEMHDVVVGEIPDDGKVDRLDLLERHEP